MICRYFLGVPIQEAVAGVAMGAITVADPKTNDITNYKVLVDLLVSY